MLVQENKTLLQVPDLVRVVLYARVSYDDRDTKGLNLSGQLEMCREYAQENGYKIVSELAEDDRGASGAEIDLPELNRVREMAQAGEFDVLVVRELDRLSRNLAKQLIVEEELKRAGVRIEYVLAQYDDTPEGRLNKHIRATIAEYEREKIKERLVRGRRNKVMAGNVITRIVPYGYRKKQVDGKAILVINEREAEFVKLIYQLYTTDGSSLRGVTKYLNEIGAPLPNSVTGNRTGWTPSTVRGILKNEAYIGNWHYGKSNPHRSKKRNERINDEANWLSISVPVIIDEDTARLAQARLIQNKQDSRRNRKHKYLLSGYVTCGRCGYKCRGHAVKSGNRKDIILYYNCPGRKKGDGYLKQCDLPYFRATDVDAVVWDWIKSLITDEAYLRIGWETYRAKQGERSAPLRNRLSVVEGLLEENREKFDRLLELYLDGDFSKEVLEGHKSQLETTINGLERERVSLRNQLENRTLSDEQIKNIQKFIAKIRPVIETADFESRRRIITLLGVEATLAIEQETKIVYARCHISEETALK